jgi:high-affinity iron transporter
MFMLALVAVWNVEASRAQTPTPEAELGRINAGVERALDSAQNGRVPTAESHYKFYDRGWLQIEDSIRQTSKTAYREIEEKMLLVDDAFALPAANDGKQAKVITALENLYNYNKNLAQNGLKSAGPDAANRGQTVTTLLGDLSRAKKRFEAGDFAVAAAEIKQFQTDWLEVEGQLKTRSAQVYAQIENDMVRAYQLLKDGSPEAGAVLVRMEARLAPYKDASGYGVFDALIILLREGLEALLVVTALLAFLQKSGNKDKQGWIWAGVGAGLAVSVGLAVVLQVIFANLATGSNREMIEGVTGLVAAAMLLYVSYWLHSKSSAASWNKYIKQQSTRVLAKGSLFGLAALAFLAIFREGAETALFYFGIASSISLSDLLIGLGIGALLLLVLGVLMIYAGIKIPVAPFFTVAGLLVFYLCFKFVGTGIHALQVGGVLSSSPADYLPDSEFFGIFPTWETMLPQLILLAVGIAVVVRGRIKNFTSVKPAVASKSTTAR